MALRAGYIGIKKSWLGLINKLSTAKIIKSIGNGLELTSAGKLNVKAATDSAIGGIKVGAGLSINNGVLNADASGFSRTNLYTGSASAAGEIVLTSAISDDDLLEFVLTDATVYRTSYMVPAYTLKHLPTDFHLSIFDYQGGQFNRSVEITYTDETHLAITGMTDGIVLAEINKY